MTSTGPAIVARQIVSAPSPALDEAGGGPTYSGILAFAAAAGRIALLEPQGLIGLPVPAGS